MQITNRQMAQRDKLEQVCKTKTEPRSDFRGWREIVGEVSRCLTKTANGVFRNLKGGYISGVRFQKCSNFSIKNFHIKNWYKIFFTSRGGVVASIPQICPYKDSGTSRVMTPMQLVCDPHSKSNQWSLCKNVIHIQKPPIDF